MPSTMITLTYHAKRPAPLVWLQHLLAQTQAQPSHPTFWLTQQVQPQARNTIETINLYKYKGAHVSTWVCLSARPFSTKVCCPSLCPNFVLSMFRPECLSTIRQLEMRYLRVSNASDWWETTFKLVGSNIQPFFLYIPANGGSRPLVIHMPRELKRYKSYKSWWFTMSHGESQWDIVIHN